MTLNLTYDHQVMALLTLYRTQAEGDFTEEEAFSLRALTNHLNYAYYTMGPAGPSRRRPRPGAWRNWCIPAT